MIKFTSIILLIFLFSCNTEKITKGKPPKTIVSDTLLTNPFSYYKEKTTKEIEDRPTETIAFDVKNILDKKDFALFEKSVENLGDKNNGISWHWESLRDLTTNSKEGVFIFTKLVPDKENPSTGSIYTFRVNIITTNKYILFYELSEEKNRQVGKNWESYYQTIAKSKDDDAFDSLKSSFKSTYNLDLDEKELFVTDFVYGDACGLVGTPPTGREQINKWILAKDKTELLKWLKSTNTEKQIYAVDGLLQLKLKGLKLTSEEIKVIKFVINKRGTMNICSGCTHYTGEIKNVTGVFKL